MLRIGSNLTLADYLNKRLYNSFKRHRFITSHQPNHVLKISDPKYFLPEIEALEAGPILKSGRTRPMMIRGVCLQDHSKGDFVVKLKGSAHMWESSSLFEILGAFIARELDFYVPEPVVINISAEFVDTMLFSHENYSIATKSIGHNFGTSLQIGFQEVVRGQSLNQELIKQLQNLFAFDVFIGNPDRRIDKPNFLTNGKEIMLYDHELAFSFTQLFSFARNPNPWNILNGDMEWLSKHYCFDYLSGNSHDFSTFADHLSVLDDDFWNKAWTLIPDDWKNKNDHFNVIKEYITKIVANRNHFANELNRVLL